MKRKMERSEGRGWEMRDGKEKAGKGQGNVELWGCLKDF